jgi:hypothetical protein
MILYLDFRIHEFVTFFGVVSSFFILFKTILYVITHYILNYSVHIPTKYLIRFVDTPYTS